METQVPVGQLEHRGAPHARSGAGIDPASSIAIIIWLTGFPKTAGTGRRVGRSKRARVGGPAGRWVEQALQPEAEIFAVDLRQVQQTVFDDATVVAVVAGHGVRSVGIFPLSCPLQ